MTLIKQFVQAMVNQDSVALSKCFSSTAIFVDYCPKDAGQPQLHAYGPEGIDMFFRNRFLFKKFQITDPLIISDTQAFTTPSTTAITSAPWPPSRTSARTARSSAWWSAPPDPAGPMHSA